MEYTHTSRYPCPCCGYHTVEEPGHYDLCAICWWEDDPMQSAHPDYCGGANIESLNEAQRNYRCYGAISWGAHPFVRLPHPDEYPDSGR